MTDLLDRYLHAVRFWLPRGQQDDILAELSEDVLSQAADEEARLGRKLNEQELAAIIKQHGAPMLVAGRYLPQQHLIGPPWFPVYFFVLKLVLLWVLLPLFVIIGIAAAVTSSHDPGMTFVRTLGGFWTGALSAFAAITVVFAVLDRCHHAMSDRNWDPRRLPAVPKSRYSRKIPRPGSVAEILWESILVLWWVDVLRIPPIPGNAVQVTMAPAWQQFYWPVLLVSLVAGILACVNLVRPWWSGLRAGIRLAIDAAIVLMAFLLMRVGPLVEITSTTITGGKLEQLRRGLESGLSITCIMIAITGTFSCIQGIRRMLPAGKNPGNSDLHDLAAPRQ